MLKKYYVLKRNDDIEYVGDFAGFSEVWDYLENEIGKNFIFIISEPRLRELREKIDVVLSKSVD
jgi:hypothetical protein